MDVEIIPVGGYSDFGRNMTCVRVDREAVILDMGVRLDRVLLDEEMIFDEAHPVDLQKIGAIPDDSDLRGIGAKVVAIVIGHGHLDHVGAVTKLAPHYPQAPIYGTPYTMALIEEMSELRPGRGARPPGGPKAHAGKRGPPPGTPGKGGERGPRGTRGRSIPNTLVPVRAGERKRLTPNIELEFVHTTHSIVQTVFPVLHTPRGAIVYANDYKFDNSPVLERAPDYRRLRSLAAEGVLALIVESTNAGKETKTESETIARDMLRDFLFGLENERVGLVVSTFSSHTARLKSICEFGTELGREVWLLGRSMDKYIQPAVELGIVRLPAGVHVAGNRRDAEKALAQIQREKGRHLVVATGHQGEPGSLLVRIANGETPFRVQGDDQVIFSANVIPQPTNVANRSVLETKLRMQGARIIKGAHVSGHASREDHHELLRMLEPEHVFPAHGGIDLQSNFVDIAERLGYKLNSTVHLLRNHDRHRLS
ncbi:MAG: MBL fold metallo-hydrolase RNA specificity domain-containing protein [Thermoplasmatota archaeon]